MPALAESTPHYTTELASYKHFHRIAHTLDPGAIRNRRSPRLILQIVAFDTPYLSASAGLASLLVMIANTSSSLIFARAAPVFALDACAATVLIRPDFAM
jgi:hypothetical protein